MLSLGNKRDLVDTGQHRRRSFPLRFVVNPKLQLSLLASIWFIAAIGMVVAALLCAFWYLFSVEPHSSSILEGWGGLYGRMAIAILGLLATMVWISIVLTHRMAGPLYRIIRRLESMSGGDLDQRVQVRGKDEFRELAEQLNCTIESLRNERKEYQKRAAQLAAELEELSRVVAGENFSGDGSDRQQEVLGRARKICSELTGDF